MSDDLNMSVWPEFPQCPQCDAPLLYGCTDDRSPYGALQCTNCAWGKDAFAESECEIQENLVYRTHVEHRTYSTFDEWFGEDL